MPVFLTQCLGFRVQGLESGYLYLYIYIYTHIRIRIFKKHRDCRDCKGMTGSLYKGVYRDSCGKLLYNPTIQLLREGLTQNEPCRGRGHDSLSQVYCETQP